MYYNNVQNNCKKVIKLKKTLCAILALVLCMSVFFTGCKDNTTPGGVVDASDNENVQTAAPITPDLEIEEGATTVEDDLGAGVEIFLTNKYFLEGTVYSGGEEPIPVKLATDGTNLQFTTDFAVEDMKISFGIIVIDEVTYVTLPGQKKYAELSDRLLAMMDMEDVISVSEFQTIKEGSDEKASITQYSVTINGEAGLCTVYTFEDTIIKLYSIGDKLIQIENFDENGAVTMQIVVDSISSQIPSDQLTLKGLEKASPTSFFSALIGAATGA